MQNSKKMEYGKKINNKKRKERNTENTTTLKKGSQKTVN